MNKNIKFSIVVPTCERASTLRFTLKTIIEQDYDNLQIIVSDNFSNDETKEVVQSFSDSRVLYVNTGRRVSMSSNWEFAYSYVDGDYVTYLGDDDGLLSDCCLEISKIINETECEAVVWKKIEYSWPCSFYRPNCLIVPMENKLLNINSKLILRAVANGYIGYARLPVIYSGFVSKSILDKIKSISGKLINSVTPDAYLGIAVAGQSNNYLYSTRPFGVNGGSGKSNGQSMHRKDNFNNVFYEEIDLEVNKEIPNIKGSVSACVAEAFLQAYDFKIIDSKLNKRNYLELIFREIMSIEDCKIKKEAFDEFIKIVHSNRKANLFKKNYLKSGNIVNKSKTHNNNIKQKVLDVDLSVIDFANISEVSKFSLMILGSYEKPRIADVTYKSILLDILSNRICSVTDKYKILPNR